MAIDQNAILQLLMQMQGGGSPQIRPTSGLEEPSLSGLRLGEQGMGLGGGGSLLGGAPGGPGGGAEGGPGLDFFQMMAALRGAGGEGIAGALPLGQGGGGTLGQQNFGAGGALLPQMGGVPQGTMAAGLGGGGALGDISALLKTLKQLSGLGGETASPTGSPGAFGAPPDVLRGIGGSDELSNVDLSMLQGTQPTQPFQGAPAAGHIMEGVGGGIAPSLTPALPRAGPAGQIMEGVGEGIEGRIPSGPPTTGSFGQVGFNIPTLAAATGLGTGALELSKGNPVGIADVLAGATALTPAGPLFGAFSLLSHLLGFGGDRPSTFKPTREAAARAGEFDVATRQQLIDRALQSQDPGLALQALQWTSRDNPWPGVAQSWAGLPARNPVRTDISMSPDVARQLGFDPTQDIQRYLGETQMRHGVATPTHRYTLRGTGAPGWQEPPQTPEQLRHHVPSPGPTPYGLYIQGPGHMADMPSPFSHLGGQPWQTGQTGLGQLGWQQRVVPGPWQRQPGTVNPEGTTYTPDVFSPGWGAFTPNQFSQFLSMYKQDPAQFNITGSGDVAYLQQGPAEALAARARQQTMDLLSQLTQWPQFA